MPGQEGEGGLAVDLVAAVEIGDLGAVGQAEGVVEPPDLGELVADPLVGGDAVGVPALDLERDAGRSGRPSRRS
jgi:hypothetical protein